MPGLARKVLICAAVDGLVLQPLHSKKDQQRTSPLIKIKYGTASVSQTSRDSVPELPSPDSSFEAFGIVGQSLRSSATLCDVVTDFLQVSLPSFDTATSSLLPAASKSPRFAVNPSMS